MLFRWHQARNSSSESRAIASFFLSLSQRRRVGTSRHLSPQSSFKVNIPEIGGRDKFPLHIFSFVSNIISLRSIDGIKEGKWLFAKGGKRCKEILCVGVCLFYIKNVGIQRKVSVEIRKINSTNNTESIPGSWSKNKVLTHLFATYVYSTETLVPPSTFQHILIHI